MLSSLHRWNGGKEAPPPIVYFDMTPELDTPYRSLAENLIGQHGEAAAANVAAEMDSCLQRNDLEGALEAYRILRMLWQLGNGRAPIILSVLHHQEDR
jgi:hypothetical protein